MLPLAALIVVDTSKYGLLLVGKVLPTPTTPGRGKAVDPPKLGMPDAVFGW
jgi:hypothetical protein